MKCNIDELKICYVASCADLSRLEMVEVGGYVDMYGYRLYRIVNDRFRFFFDVFRDGEPVAQLKFGHYTDMEVASNRYDADARYVELMATPKMTFKACCEKYAELKPKPGKYSLKENEQLTRLRYLCPQACDAVDKLGIDAIREMKFQKSNILRKVASICDDAQGLIIKRELDRRLSKFQAYPVSLVKRVLGEVYQDCGFNKKPVATDLDR